MQKSETNLGFLLNKVTHLIKWELNNQLKAYHLTSAQWAILADIYVQHTIEKKPDYTTPALIAERLKVQRPAITRTIDKMQKDGWVVRHDNPLDGRSQHVGLTQKAHDVLPKLEKVSEAVIEKAFDGFNHGEVDLLRTLLTKIITNFN